jgi:hypothetical protein
MLARGRVLGSSTRAISITSQARHGALCGSRERLSLVTDRVSLRHDDCGYKERRQQKLSSISVSESSAVSRPTRLPPNMRQNTSGSYPRYRQQKLSLNGVSKSSVGNPTSPLHSASSMALSTRRLKHPISIGGVVGPLFRNVRINPHLLYAPWVRKVVFLVLCRGRECTYCQWADAAATATLSRGANTPIIQCGYDFYIRPSNASSTYAQ